MDNKEESISILQNMNQFCGADVPGFNWSFNDTVTVLKKLLNTIEAQYWRLEQETTMFCTLFPAWLKKFDVVCFEYTLLAAVEKWGNCPRTDGDEVKVVRLVLAYAGNSNNKNKVDAYTKSFVPSVGTFSL
ncbi:Hypothetical protein, putative [Bodo saltans]|uniref:Uncharacterized protein n=1 Tax=Bodo saltans TaxID=75058 RepID=A0A0S4KGG0_BODSA|nr:Hypothetical protein, putative [Bodo saltans]|eukprot:CUI14752.1 Hypothetical protein, putative [Bodo saltans]